MKRAWTGNQGTDGLVLNNTTLRAGLFRIEGTLADFLAGNTPAPVFDPDPDLDAAAFSQAFTFGQTCGF